MTKRTGGLAAIIGISALVVAVAINRAQSTATTADDGPHRRTLVASIRSEPESLNPYTARPDLPLDVLTRLLHAPLVRLDPRTDVVQPWLAERIVPHPDGLSYTLQLRKGLVFSDGTPFSSADVVAAVRAVTDPENQSYLADTFTIAGKPIDVRAVDPWTVVVTFPAPYGPGIRILANLPILPASRLPERGTLRALWSQGAPVHEVVGLGPFVLADYVPGQRLVLTRNPRYWRRDDQGRMLPYLDRLVLEVIPEQNGELLRLEAGEIDLTATEARAQDLPILQRAARNGRVRLTNLGAGLDANALWFNLRSDPSDTEPAWLRSDIFRQAVSRAVDRDAFADFVYLGLARPIYGPVSPANVEWHSPSIPTYPFNRDRARELLASLGLRDRDRDGMLEDARGGPVRFALLTQAGNTSRERGAAFIRDALRQVGITVDVVKLEVGALFTRFTAGLYDAMYFGVQTASTDPADQLEFWLSSGHFHFWHPKQRAPQREWERQIDELMIQQVATSDRFRRKKLFEEVQRVFGAHVPAIYFAAPHVVVATSMRVGNATPAIMQPQVLWNAETLTVESISH